MDKNKKMSTISHLFVKAGFLAVTFFAMNGCSVFNVGESEYSCPGRSKGVTCANTREIYTATNNGQLPTPVSLEEARNGKSTVVGRSEGDSSKTAESDSGNPFVEERRQQVVEQYITPNLPDKPIPIRTPATVMRIWVAPWEDTDGDLNASGYIYTEIMPRRWVITDGAEEDDRSLAPLGK